MYVKTLYQPFANGIFSRMKMHETSSRPTSIRGRAMIHAAKSIPPAVRLAFLQAAAEFGHREYSAEWLENLPRGAILGSVEIIGCRPVEQVRSGLPSATLLFGDYSDGRWAWELANPILFSSPISIAGKQGWWKYDECAETEEIK